MRDIAKYNQELSLARFKKEHGEQYVMKALVDVLLWLRGQVNVKGNLTEEQMFTIADIIREEYYWFRIDDVKKCFKNGLLGKYGEQGEMYNKLDVSVISKWLAGYENERVAKIEHHQKEVVIDYGQLKALSMLQAYERKRKRYSSLEEWCEAFGHNHSELSEKIEAHKTERLEILGECLEVYLRGKVLTIINHFGLERMEEAIKILSNI